MKRVFLALPRRGQVEMAHAFSVFVHATESMDKIGVGPYPRDASLLALCFNQCWCAFENDGTFDYFAMLHNDHCPGVQQSIIDAAHHRQSGSALTLEQWLAGKPKRDGFSTPGWLDVMVEEMEANQFGVLHAAAAIKDARGLTSTALGGNDFYFDPVRRITIKELYTLPETFGYKESAETLGYVHPKGCLLPNTGVMLISKDRFPVSTFPGFFIKDCIDRSSGVAIPYVASEDWNLGRWCGLHGISVGCTRKVVTNHMGGWNFSTNSVWGKWDTDDCYKEFLEKSCDTTRVPEVA